MYCFPDDLLPHMCPVTARKSPAGRRLNDARLLTTALVAARYFGGNLVLGQRYPEQHGGPAKRAKMASAAACTRWPKTWPNKPRAATCKRLAKKTAGGPTNRPKSF